MTRRVLVVDDDVSMCELLEDDLGKSGFETVSRRSAGAALELHHLRAGAHQFNRASECLFRCAVSAERQVGHDQRRRPIEDGARPTRPGLDVASVLSPEQEQEERDRQQERDAGEHVERVQRRLQAEDDDRDRDQDEDREPAQGPVGAHRIRLAVDQPSAWAS